MWTVLVIVGLMAFGVSAQPAAPSLGFEVAAVKRCRSSESPHEGATSPGRLNLACVTTANLIRLAYLVFPTGQPNAPVSPGVFQMPILGGPSWINSDLYRIEAKTKGPANIELMKGPMMQALLESRFKLKLHREARRVDDYELRVASGGPKLGAALSGACVVFDRNHPPAEPVPGEPRPVICGRLREAASGGFDIAGVTLPDLCRQLSAFVDREIVDRTGIQGRFDLHLDLSPADLGYPGTVPDPSSPFKPGDGGAIASAVKKLGLQMRAAKSSAQFLVIDHVEKPSEN